MTRIAVNKSINLAKSARKTREEYYGPWIPEPLSEELEAQLERKEQVNYAMMVVFERLEPKERAVFLLKDVFGYSHQEISDLLDISVLNSRQVLTRAKRIIAKSDVQTVREVGADRSMIALFVKSIEDGNIAPFIEKLTSEATMQIDGGKRRQAPLRVLHTPLRIGAFLRGVAEHDFFGDSRELRLIDEQICILIKENGILVRIIFLSLNVEGDKVQSVFVVTNPDKLKKNLRNCVTFLMADLSY
ncbi:sigma factor-like helix-turn-helix DNA-binding protein [Listeria cornellensis]|uniref:RNA polymerase sigma-70 factor n=1 Tax=Listeria cornellensis FSL F6-0969 TaxID=1265820 RepID=W7CI24_9LIST|nr:sigma factor-like helix-turn-helix DNA-binding protein [Listeria cornellensis]EUJ32593.1 RNA polymerase sigma-70 factor [Listeria cornellensis FSL F6-0969]